MRIAEAGRGGFRAIDNHQDFTYRIVYVSGRGAVRRVVFAGLPGRAENGIPDAAAHHRAGCGQRPGERLGRPPEWRGCPGRAAATGVPTAKAGAPASRAVTRGNARAAPRAAMRRPRFGSAGEMAAVARPGCARLARSSRVPAAWIEAGSMAIRWPAYREMTLARVIALRVRRRAIDGRQSRPGPTQRLPRVVSRERDCPACGASRRGFPPSFVGPPEIFPSSALPAGRSGSGFQLPETSWKHLRPGDGFPSKLLWELYPLPHVIPGGSNLDKTARRKVRLRSASGCLVSMGETDL